MEKTPWSITPYGPTGSKDVCTPTLVNGESRRGHFFFFQAEDGIRDADVTGVQTCALPIFKFESGAHRVQRVPATESQGRIHTSACTVAVMAEAEEAGDIEIRNEDLRIDTYRSEERRVGKEWRSRWRPVDV